MEKSKANQISLRAKNKHYIKVQKDSQSSRQMVHLGIGVRANKFLIKLYGIAKSSSLLKYKSKINDIKLILTTISF